MGLDSIYSEAANLWVTVGDSISFRFKEKNKDIFVNGIVKIIVASSITLQLYEKSFLKSAILPDTSKLAGLNYVVLSCREVKIKPENVLGSIIVAHLSFFENSTLPYHLGFDGVFAIEKRKTTSILKKKKIYGFEKVSPSDYSPLPNIMTLPLRDINIGVLLYRFRCVIRTAFSDAMSKKGGYTNRATKGVRCNYFELNNLFLYAKDLETSVTSSYKEKTSKLREERGSKVRVCFKLNFIQFIIIASDFLRSSVCVSLF